MMPTLEKTLHIGYDEALLELPQALKAEGFGVLTAIDVRDTLQKKLGVEFHKTPEGNATVLAIDPLQTLAAKSPALVPIAEEVRGRLSRVLASLP
jgi:hypothetical protein